MAIFGEVGLLGEVRAVSRAAERVREAAALGFARVAIPARDARTDLALPATSIGTVADIPCLLHASDRGN
jgi:DNA repair protein RadA/Sms